jgi:hypothetical protein
LKAPAVLYGRCFFLSHIRICRAHGAMGGPKPGDFAKRYIEQLVHCFIGQLLHYNIGTFPDRPIFKSSDHQISKSIH